MSHWQSGIAIGLAIGFGFVVVVYVASAVLYVPPTYHRADATALSSEATTTDQAAEETLVPAWPAPLDTAAYDSRLLRLISYVPPQPAATTSTSSLSAATSQPTPQYSSSTNVTIPGQAWPPAAPYPHGGAILPFERIVAYYGNFYSTRMGILGEFPREQVLAQLASTSAAWEAADPDTPVRPAIHYIAMVAQAEAGSDGMYRNVMPDEHIERAYSMAKEIDGIMFLDLQVGLSTIQRELPQFREYFTRPEVHLGIDPEFSMKTGDRPGTVIGSFNAADINFTIEWLSEIVRENQLPPKVLILHRFTQDMIQGYHDIRPTPEVQVVMHMDGWGSTELKTSTYRRVVEPEPVQFAGLKIFYGNDLKAPSTGIFTPAQALKLHPEPVYIQYQ
jgi:hypothetical protein